MIFTSFVLSLKLKLEKIYVIKRTEIIVEKGNSSMSLTVN